MQTVDKNLNQSLVEAYRNLRGISQEAYIPVKETKPAKKTTRTRKNDYESFSARFDEITIEEMQSFTAPDLLNYFRHTSEEAGHKYYVANYAMEMKIFKRLLQTYQPIEICLMVEFLFESNQNYITLPVAPRILASSWNTTIYRDSQLWVVDKYVPYERKRTVPVPREWKKSANNEVSLGEWN